MLRPTHSIEPKASTPEGGPMKSVERKLARIRFGAHIPRYFIIADDLEISDPILKSEAIRQSRDQVQGIR